MFGVAVGCRCMGWWVWDRALAPGVELWAPLKHPVVAYEVVGKAGSGQEGPWCLLRHARFAFSHALVPRVVSIVRMGAFLDDSGKESGVLTCMLARCCCHVLTGECLHTLKHRRGDNHAQQASPVAVTSPHPARNPPLLLLLGRVYPCSTVHSVPIALRVTPSCCCDVRVQDQEPRNTEPDKCAGWQWVPWRGVPEPVFLPLRLLLDSPYTPFPGDK